MILSPRLAATTVSREVVQTPEINEKDGEHGLRLCQGNFSVLSAAPFRCCSFSGREFLSFNASFCKSDRLA